MATAHLMESLALHQAVGNQAGIARTLTNLGLVAAAQGAPEAGRAVGEILEIVRTFGPGADTRNALVVAAALAAPAASAHLLGASAHLLADQQAVLPPLTAVVYHQIAQHAAALLGEPAYQQAAFTAGAALDGDAALTLAKAVLMAPATAERPPLA